MAIGYSHFSLTLVGEVMGQNDTLHVLQPKSSGSAVSKYIIILTFPKNYLRIVMSL